MSLLDFGRAPGWWANGTKPRSCSGASQPFPSHNLHERFEIFFADRSELELDRRNRQMCTNECDSLIDFGVSGNRGLVPVRQPQGGAPPRNAVFEEL